MNGKVGDQAGKGVLKGQERERVFIFLLPRLFSCYLKTCPEC